MYISGMRTQGAGIVAPGGGGGAVDAADVTFDGTVMGLGATNVQVALDTSSMRFGPTMPVITSVADLPPPDGGGARDLLVPSRIVGDIILGAGEYIRVKNNATVKGVTTQDSRIIGDRAGPLVVTDPLTVFQTEIADVAISNLNAAGEGIKVEGQLVMGAPSTPPRPTVVPVLSRVTVNAAKTGEIKNCAFAKIVDFAMSTWLDGLRFTGVIGSVGMQGQAIIDPGQTIDAGYRAVRVPAGTVVGAQLVIRFDFDGLTGGGRGVLLDPAAIYAGGPSTIRLLGCTGRPSTTDYLDPAGLTASDSEVYVVSGTPDTPSKVFGGAEFSTPADHILIDYAVETTPVQIPGRSIGLVDLSPNPGNERVDLTVDAAPAETWRMTYTGAEDADLRLVWHADVLAASGSSSEAEIYAVIVGVGEVPDSRLRFTQTNSAGAIGKTSNRFKLLNGQEIEFFGVKPAGTGTVDTELLTFDATLETVP